MFTPQEIQEKTFVKAVFGGYDMETVDEFLEPLTEDYITLYKENAVLKSKMRVLVEKLEEYRSQEASMRKAILNAQRTAESMVAEAEKKCARMMSEAEHTVQDKSVDLEQALGEEEERVNCAKQTALNFIDVLEKDIKGHLDLLESLKKRDLRQEHQYNTAPQRQKAFDYEVAEKPLVMPKSAPKPEPEPAPKPEPASAPQQPKRQPAPEPELSFQSAPVKPEPAPAIEFDFRTTAPETHKSESPEEIASEIEQNLSRLMDLEDPAQPAPAHGSHPESTTVKFTNLQFGRNYDPTAGK